MISQIHAQSAFENVGENTIKPLRTPEGLRDLLLYSSYMATITVFEVAKSLLKAAEFEKLGELYRDEVKPKIDGLTLVELVAKWG